MNPNDVIETYVVDVIRRVPAKQRDEIGFELRGLLQEMLADRAESQGRAADDAMVLAMLRDFGAPADIAARYRPPGRVIIPAEQTKSFALWSMGGLVLQWALTFPGFSDHKPLMAWWFTWGLGAFWWPGFMVTMSLIATLVRDRGWLPSAWTPRTVDADRINRNAVILGLVWSVLGAGFVLCLPWIVDRLPGVLPQVFAFDAEFLRARAWPVLVLWLAHFAVYGALLKQGRWSPLLRRIETIATLAWIALLAWWISAGNIFQAPNTNEGARGALALVIFFIVLGLVVSLYQQRTRIRTPNAAT